MAEQSVVLQQVRDILDLKTADLNALSRKVAEQSLVMGDLREAVEERDERLLDLRIRLEAVYKSSSWRLTTPIRKLSLFSRLLQFR